jgi:hypothetical protein
MRQILGILIIAVAIISGFFLGVYMLVYGLWDIVHNFSTLTFGQFFWDLLIIIGREFVAAIIIYGGLFAGISLGAGSSGSSRKYYRDGKSYNKGIFNSKVKIKKYKGDVIRNENITDSEINIS